VQANKEHVVMVVGIPVILNSIKDPIRLHQTLVT